jgi:MoxR-like ATPase
MVMATQNPIEYEGTFPLPEAQLDRFLMRLSIGYPNMEDEKRLLTHLQREHPINHLEQVVSESQMAPLQHLVWNVHVDESLHDYIIRLVTATRNHPDLMLGGSPRASLALFKSAQAFAALRGRDHVIPDDIKNLVLPTLAHRLIVRPEAELRGRTSVNIMADVVKNTPLEIK